jgi:hypothetical protein
MPDDFAMRMQLHRVVAYRDLCRAVRRSGRENVFYASLMLFLAYIAWDRGMDPVIVAVYGSLVAAELAIGLFKWAFPSAEGYLLDGLVLLAFAGVYIGVQFQKAQVGRALEPIVLFLGLYMFWGAINRFKAYRQLRRMFAERPTAEHMAWFDDLIAEIRDADPQSDELALDLPTKPHWKAKLLGTMAFFVGTRGKPIWIAGPDDFELLREKTDHGTGRRKAVLFMEAMQSPEFEISDVTWANYQKWRAANPMTGNFPPAIGGLG